MSTLASIVPGLNPIAKQVLVRVFDQQVLVLRGQGMLTADQASTLAALAAGL